MDADKLRVRIRLADDAKEQHRLFKSELENYGEYFTKAEKDKITDLLFALEELQSIQ